ncbi:hypothetical protein D2A34_12480 [Clostridium chromiireducens]|uniref:Uncharacterized protein n=1 Tax=Clostridium chromiireducens TaxID=225345 RepID=A0A399ISS0_9CLOT|nr:hypothetical protein D2A34_12480 [Clostridium chromiireducens]
MTSRTGTTFAEEIPTAIFSMQHYEKEYLLFLVWKVFQSINQIHSLDIYIGFLNENLKYAQPNIIINKNILEPVAKLKHDAKMQQ